MMKIVSIAATAAVLAATLVVATPAVAITYTGTSTFQGATIDFSISTDNTLGIISAANITNWTISAVVPETPSFVLTPGNSFLSFAGSSLSTTSTALIMDYGAAAPSCHQFLNASITQFWFFGTSSGCGEPNFSRETVSSDVGFKGALRQPRFGVVTLGTAPGVPEPAAWAMLIAGFGLVGALQRRRLATTLSA
jgi:hypothetical protein